MVARAQDRPQPGARGPADEHTDLPRFRTTLEPLGGVMGGLLPLLRSQLEPLLADDETLLVLTDDAGTVLAREGGRTITRLADTLGFAPGSSWTEQAVGTNAIGTSLAMDTPVHVHAAEHFCLSHHVWSCAAAPVHDPRNGRTLGVIDLSFRAAQAHPTAIALAVSLARQAELALRDAHRRSLRRLRDQLTTAPTDSAWVLVDSWGWVADAAHPLQAERVTMPEQVEDAVMVAGIGVMRAQPVDGGWLLREQSAAGSAAGIRVRLGQNRCEVLVRSDGHEWTHVFVGRRAAIVRALAEAREGMSSQQLSTAVYGTPTSEVAVRAEVHRIRREVGGLISTRPYRLARGVTVTRR